MLLRLNKNIAVGIAFEVLALEAGALGATDSALLEALAVELEALRVFAIAGHAQLVFRNSLLGLRLRFHLDLHNF